MATGQKYENGILEGFLRSRAATAFLNARDSEHREASLEWVRAAIAFQTAYESYQKHGDSEEVQRLTGEGMDHSDKAIALEKKS